MSESKHTPGPWLYANRSAGAHIHANDGEIAWLRSYMGIADKQIDANARLIAAAPELLEIVEAFIAETVDYATINNLGDPEKQHNVKWARKILATLSPPTREEGVRGND